MQKFQSADIPEQFYRPETYVARFGVSMDEAHGMVHAQVNQQYFMNDQYQVTVGGPHRTQGDAWPPMWHLSIKRLDKDAIHDWRDLQTIKNMLVGEENEAIEIYPAESRLVDMANQYHLWVFVDPEVRIPIGYQTRMVGGAEQAESVGARQREFS